MCSIIYKPVKYDLSREDITFNGEEASLKQIIFHRIMEHVSIGMY